MPNDFMPESRDALKPSDGSNAAARSEPPAAGVVEALVSDLRRRAQACRDLRPDTLLSSNRLRLSAKAAAYDHAAELVAATQAGGSDA